MKEKEKQKKFHNKRRESIELEKLVKRQTEIDKTIEVKDIGLITKQRKKK